MPRCEVIFELETKLLLTPSGKIQYVTGTKVIPDVNYRGTVGAHMRTVPSDVTRYGTVTLVLHVSCSVSNLGHPFTIINHQISNHQIIKSSCIQAAGTSEIATLSFLNVLGCWTNRIR